MGRKLKPREVGTYKHPSGVDVVISLDRDSREFFATPYEGEEIREKSYDEVTRKLEEFFDTMTALDWRPIIFVDDGSLTNFSFNRKYIAQTKDGQWRELDWEGYLERSIVEPGVEYRWQRASNTEMERLRISHWLRMPDGFTFDKLPVIDKERRAFGRRDSVEATLAYTEEKWLALQAIQAAIEKLDEQLQKLLGTNKGLATLQAAGAKAAKLMLTK